MARPGERRGPATWRIGSGAHDSLPPAPESLTATSTPDASQRRGARTRLPSPSARTGPPTHIGPDDGGGGKGAVDHTVNLGNGDTITIGEVTDAEPETCGDARGSVTPLRRGRGGQPQGTSVYSKRGTSCQVSPSV
jgi:hypothetical protein